jgi:hypothetical protein
MTVRIRFNTYPGIFLFAILLAFGCSKGDKKEASESSKRSFKRKQVRKPPIPQKELWRISSRSVGEMVGKAKSIRKEGIAPRVYLADLFAQAATFFELKRPLQPGDSTERHAGYDFNYFLPVSEVRKPGPVTLRYRRGNDSIPGLISLVDTAGPNNLDVHPFFWKERVLFFAEYFGKDSNHENGTPIPGFFVKDFSSEKSLYFKPQSGLAPDSSIRGYAEVMLLGTHLLPEKSLQLSDGNVVTRADYLFRDTMKYATVYSYRFGKRCDFEWLDDGIYVKDLMAHMSKNRCGGDKQKMSPQMASRLLPLWTETKAVEYLAVPSSSQPKRPKKEKPLQAWKIHMSGRGNGQKTEAPSPVSLDKILRQGATLEANRPNPDERLYQGKGLDLRKLVVNTDKPGNEKRFVRYHENDQEQLDFVSLVDSAGGFANVELFPEAWNGRVLYRLHYFGQDASHTNGRKVPGFFLFDPETRANYRFVPEGKEAPGALKELGAIELLDQDWMVSKALIFETGVPVAHRSYNYDRTDSRDRHPEGWRTMILKSEKKPCAFFP